MYIGQFIYKNHKGGGITKSKASSYTTINHSYDVILWYGDGYIYEYKEREYKYEDEYGKYRISMGGSWGQKSLESLSSYGERLIIKDGKAKGAKFYEKDDDNKVRVNCFLDGGTNNIYPTAKPYKLLERIICLGTK